MIVFGSAAVSFAQDDDLFPSGRKEPAPHGFQEALIKLRIEKDKKDFNEMLKRGDDAVKLADELDQHAVAGQRDQIAALGKLVKKIRDELGGGDSDDDKKVAPASESAAVEQLKVEVNGLSDELKRSKRFTISAAAIDRANAILRLVKYLRG